MGEVDDASKELVRTTYECLKMAIDEGTGTVSFESIICHFSETVMCSLYIPLKLLIFQN